MQDVKSFSQMLSSVRTLLSDAGVFLEVLGSLHIHEPQLYGWVFRNVRGCMELYDQNH